MTEQESLKVLIAFDFGTKKMGVAVGQTITQTARPLTTLTMKDGEPSWEAITEMMNRYQPDACVVGIPLNMDGTEQRLSARARAFAASLRERYSVLVFEMDERLTTKDAKERLFTEGGYKALQDGQVDQVAAQLILQAWFAENFKNFRSR